MVAPRNTVQNGTRSHFLPLFPTRCHYREARQVGQQQSAKNSVTAQALSADRRVPFWARGRIQKSATYESHFVRNISSVFFWRGNGSRPISRVLSRATIHLGCTSPCTSSGLPGSTRGSRAAACTACFPIWPCSRRGLPCRRRCRRRGALLPHRFTLAVVLAHAWAVCSLLHFPWAHAPQALPGALPFGARTFLRFPAKTAVAWPTPATNIVATAARLKWNRRASPR